MAANRNDIPTPPMASNIGIIVSCARPTPVTASITPAHAALSSMRIASVVGSRTFQYLGLEITNVPICIMCFSGDLNASNSVYLGLGVGTLEERGGTGRNVFRGGVAIASCRN